MLKGTSRNTRSWPDCWTSQSLLSKDELSTFLTQALPGLRQLEYTRDSLHFWGLRWDGSREGRAPFYTKHTKPSPHCQNPAGRTWAVTPRWCLYLRLPTVTLLSIFHVAIPTLLATKGLLDFRQVKETHSHSFLQAVFQVLSTAATEDHGEWIAGEKPHGDKRKAVIWDENSLSCHTGDILPHLCLNQKIVFSFYHTELRYSNSLWNWAQPINNNNDNK